MIITPIKTDKILPEDKKTITQILDQNLTDLKENSVLVITSKIISITEGRVVKIVGSNKDELIKQESQFYLDRNENPYAVSLTITNDNLVATAGIDESNGNGFYVLWPKDAQGSTNQIRKYLREKFNIKNLGVIISDSKTAPLRWGVTSFALGYSGITPLIDYTGKPDLFGRPFKFEKLNVIDSLSTAATLVMGEGAEQTPMAVIEDLPFVEFKDEDPSEEELQELKISKEEDIYAPLLTNAPWKKGEKE